MRGTGLPSTEMEKVVPLGQGLRRSHSKRAATSNNLAASLRTSAVTQLLIFKTFSLYKFSVMLVFATTYLNTVSADQNFTIPGTSYDCSPAGNVICIGGAHKYNGTEIFGINVGRLSLIYESIEYVEDSAGLAYYKEQIRLLDPSTQQSASFATSFQFDARHIGIGYGMGLTFVLREDPKPENALPGNIGNMFGIFYRDGTTNFRTIVVEFDSFKDGDKPWYDINENHVSFDFGNVTSAAAASAWNVGVDLRHNTTIYAWVDYSNEIKQLEVRVAYNDSRPTDPLLQHPVNLSDFAAEYMWVGFSGANAGLQTGDYCSYYYVGNWKFESWGIPPAIPATDLVVLGSFLGVSALVLACFVLLFFRERFIVKLGYIWKRFSKKDLLRMEGLPEQFTYEELALATRDFGDDSTLGRGGFGSVHRGILPSGIEVAVKKINADSTQGENEFMAEISIINQSRHRNLIQLLGWCKDAPKKQYLLVYELMSNGSLDKWLFRPAHEKTTRLSWPRRFSIVKGTALALEYLHHGGTRKVIHRDIKPSNIMLDEKFNAKLGDFGLSRLVDHQDATPTTGITSETFKCMSPQACYERSTQQTTKFAGTFGYIAPEAFISRRCTDQTDVYAFGVVVLEVACGRRAYLRHDLPSEQTYLLDWVWRKMDEGEILSVVDGGLGDYDPMWMEVMLKIGLLCTHDDYESRPSMGLVVRVLAGDTPIPPIPPRSISRRRISIDDLISRESWGSTDKLNISSSI